MRFRDVEHLFRLAAIFAVCALLFVVLKAEMRPKDFGKYGHYRPAGVDAVRARAITFAGQKACADCHTDVVETRALARHTAVACEACHGPLAKHADGTDEAKPVRPDGTVLCARCHAAKTGKPKRYPRVDIKEHAGGETCLTCHKPHDPRIR
jgi:uncharacterized CHY-type Zn-finger protein